MLLKSTVSAFPSSTSNLHNLSKASPSSTYLITAHNYNPWKTSRKFGACRRRTTPRTLSKVSSSSENQTAVVVAAPSENEAAEIVRSFYGGINRRDLASVEPLIAEKCVYEDLIFPRPFVGRQAILDFFKSFMDSISKDLQFVIDDISAEDSSAVGVTWHLEWRGKAFPFSKGCSFYRLEMVDGQRQIIYGRDVVEPAIKPGEAALGAIRAVTWLLQKFPQLADQL
ncbi:hypothetical protein COLO4_09994 [Corchorus olitorius]|uniref:SnoaL-like domain-containing protein n=1 Tax=Corchorus olitorius TaxID=93759 RepID=A0A1R3KAD5_9ROSI|nr:hypothetical protein COLO4_09994 [Corchorus olitorius]